VANYGKTPNELFQLRDFSAQSITLAQLLDQLFDLDLVAVPVQFATLDLLVLESVLV
jgi:hypothetical protein